MSVLFDLRLADIGPGFSRFSVILFQAASLEMVCIGNCLDIA